MRGPDKLAYLANQIASFFRSYPDDEAIAGIHDHIRSFWTPAMRRALIEHADGGATGLDPLVVRALHVLSTGVSPAHRESAGPAELGEVGASDAG